MDIYARISVDYDGTMRSCDSQVAEALLVFEETYAPQGWVLGRVFKDPFLSGWKPTVIRKDWLQLMERLAAGTSHGVIFYDVQRFTRKPKEAEALLEIVEQHRTLVHSLALEAPYPLHTPDGRKNFRDAATAAAYESDKTSRRSRRGNALKAASGRYLHTFRPFGMDGLLPKPEGWQEGDPRERVPAEQLERERWLVRDAADRLLKGGKGNSLGKLAEKYNAMGIPTLRGNQWTAVTLRQVLERPSIAGVVDHHGEIVGQAAEVAQGARPALRRETWDRLMEKLAARRRGRPPAEALLTGHARCGKCGQTLNSRPTYKHRGPDGKFHADGRQYYCKKGQGCGRLFIDMAYADGMVKAATLLRLSQPEHAAALRGRSERGSAADAARRKLVGEIADGEATARSLGAKLAAGQMTEERYWGVINPLDERLVALRAKLAQLEAATPQDELAVEDAAAAWAEAEAQDDLDTLRALVRKAFPNLVILGGTRGRASGPERFDWAGDQLANVRNLG